MIDRLSRLPLFLLLAAIGGAAMLVPAAQALILGQYPLAAIFAQSAAAVLLVVTLVALAAGPGAARRRAWCGHGGLATLAARSRSS